MNDRLSDHFPWSHTSDLSGKFILCLDDSSRSAEFALVYILIAMLKQGRPVCIVCTNHSPSHYEILIRKHTLDPRILQINGQLTFITIVIDKSNDSDSKVIEYTWEEFVDWTAKGFILRTQEKFALFLDDLEALEVMSSNPLELRKLISRCNIARSDPIDSCLRSSLHSLVAFGRQTISSTECVHGVYRDVQLDSHSVLHGAMRSIAESHESKRPSCSSDGETAIVEYCKYKCDINIVVQGLESGYSMETHGSITITTNNPNIFAIADRTGQSNQGGIGAFQQVLLFKALDTGVKATRRNPAVKV